MKAIYRQTQSKAAQGGAICQAVTRLAMFNAEMYDFFKDKGARSRPPLKHTMKHTMLATSSRWQVDKRRVY